MIGLVFLRVLFVLIFGAIGYSLGADKALLSAGIGSGVALVIVLLEAFGRQVSLKGLSSAAFGIFLGLTLAWIVGKTLEQLPIRKDVTQDFINNIKIFVTFIFVYLGLTLGIKGKDESHLVIP